MSNAKGPPVSVSMTGAEVDDIRQALERALGMRITLRRFGIALGLRPERAKDTMRSWIQRGPSGPAATVLRLFRIAAYGEKIEPTAIHEGARRVSASLLAQEGKTFERPEPDAEDREDAAAIFRAMLTEHVRALLLQADDQE